MISDLRKAVAFLKNLMAISTSSSTGVDRTRLDALLPALLDIAIDDVERFTSELAMQTIAAADRLAEDEASAARNAIEEAERAEREANQAETDAAEREERSRAGIS